ncbi:MAG: stage V sporulation protein AD [Clostridia bacterium]|nr:stage V sporulation protein AD [Clostridia bacterium]MDD4047683.1 stage V sporulation protein AD [Clostridia bacterium]
MAQKKLGKQTFKFSSNPIISSEAAVVGPMEGKGPLGEKYDMVLDNTFAGENTWEKAEQKMMQYSMELALEKKGFLPSDLDIYLAGDLLNQIISANFTARFLNTPFLGLYGACSTLIEGLCVAGILLDGGFVDRIGVSASSHHNTAERQYRYPTEQGTQRPMTAQWTVTGSGSFVVENSGSGVILTHATIGKINDMGISNANDMGSAMAPAAFDTIKAHLQDTGRKPDDYDLIVTGDLGLLGSNVLKEMMRREKISVDNITDCGTLVYSSNQDSHSGGSGCGCSAIVLSSHFMGKLLAGEYKKIFFVGTGALLSPITSFQGESIPSIAHGIVLEYMGGRQ